MANYKVGDKVTVRKRVDAWTSPWGGGMVHWAMEADKIIGQQFTIMEVRCPPGYSATDYRLKTFPTIDWNYLFPEESFGDEIGKQLEFSFMKDPET